MKHLFFLALLLTFWLIQSTNAQTRSFNLPNGASYDVTINDTTAPGYLFLGSYSFGGAAPFASSLLLLDDNGTPAFYMEHPRDSGTIGDLRLYENGLMSFFFFDEGTLEGQYYIMDSTFTIIDTVQCDNGLKTDGHEMILLDNGNYMLICLEERILDISGIVTIDGRSGSTQGQVIGPVIQELDANGNAVFEWKGLEYYSLSDIDPYFFLDSTFLDFGHPNALAIDLDGNILLSLRFFNEITKINYSDSSIIWRLGGLQNDFTFVNDTQPFSAQHNCNVLPNGNLTLYDNGEKGNPPLARGVEYVLDQTNLTATKVWEYANTPGITSYSLGSMQRLDNGHNLIDWGAGFPPHFSNDVVEVDAAGNTLMTFDWPEIYYSYRAYKYLPEWDLEKLRPALQCDTTQTNNVILTALGDFDSYLWNTGDTTPSITVDTAGEYYVLAKKNSDNKYFGSRLKVINDLTKACVVDSMDTYAEDLALASFQIYPNPATTSITLKSVGNTGNANLTLYNALGGQVFSYALGIGITHVDIQQIAKGSYIGLVTSESGQPLQRFKLIVVE